MELTPGQACLRVNTCFRVSYLKVYRTEIGNQARLCCPCFLVLLNVYPGSAELASWAWRKNGSHFTCKVDEFIPTLLDETRHDMKACWSKPLFSGKGSCLGFPTLTQKFTLAHGSRKPTGYEGGSRTLMWKTGWNAEKCYSTKYFGAGLPSRISRNRESV